MCYVDINRSTLDCSHVWYHFIKPCATKATLETCPGKLCVEGWEIRCDFCPYCANWPLPQSEFRLVGGQSRSNSIIPSVRHNSVSSSASSVSNDAQDGLARSTTAPDHSPSRRRPSVITVSGARKLSRQGSLQKDTREHHLYDMSPVLAASEKNARMNALVERYAESAIPVEALSFASPVEPRRAELPRRDSIMKKRESVIAEEGDQSSWKKHSKRLSGIFRKGSY